MRLPRSFALVSGTSARLAARSVARLAAELGKYSSRTSWAATAAAATADACRRWAASTASNIATEVNPR
jgi:hypothetical protein